MCSDIFNVELWIITSWCDPFGCDPLFQSAPGTTGMSYKPAEIHIQLMVTFPYAHCSLLQVVLARGFWLPKHRTSQGIWSTSDLQSYEWKRQFNRLFLIKALGRLIFLHLLMVALGTLEIRPWTSRSSNWFVDLPRITLRKTNSEFTPENRVS